MDPGNAVELDTASLQHVFSFLSRNHLVLLIKPLSKRFKEHLVCTLQGTADKVVASDDVPLVAAELKSTQPNLQAEEAVNAHSCQRRMCSDLAVS